MLRYNNALAVPGFEGYANGEWGSIGGGATNSLFYENDQTITADQTLASGKNSGTFGPIEIANGVTVTVPTGVTWSVV